MPRQSQLFPDHEPTVLPPPPSGPSETRRAAAPVWLQRLSLLVLVLFCVYLGVLVLVLPWSTRMWDNNLFFQSHPALGSVLHHGAVRGIISGLGLLDIWIGISEAVHYRDYRG
ncbi:MAG TPA: hypothetical protein VGB69_02285 [Edaphobacter sp.]